MVISPPAWGWPGRMLDHATIGADFPTRVGMARLAIGSGACSAGFPHPRGDGPTPQGSHWLHRLISPPAWGWPENTIQSYGNSLDFPTRVGMARGIDPARCNPAGFPHPRGDGPNRIAGHGPRPPISPPAWGWPAMPSARCIRQADFPTRVGMARSHQPSGDG